jgi:peptidylprolyl isomerase
LEFEVGSGSVIAGFDNGVTGMKVGDKKTVNIPVDEAYGQVQDDLLMEFPLDRFPAEMKPEVGMELNMSNGAGQNFPVVITEVLDNSVVLDANHPLAGEDLTFDLELVEIKGKSPLIIMP